MGDANKPWIALAALLAVTGAVLAPVFDNGFVYDDVDVIVRSDAIHDPRVIPDLFAHNAMWVTEAHRDDKLTVDTYRPVTLTSFVWDAALSGRAPWAYHLTNLVMHLLCVVLVFAFVRELMGAAGSRAWPAALFGTAVFALSPHPASAHVWINGRSDLFCTFFGLVALLTWRRGLDPRCRSGAGRALLLAGSALAFLLGLLSKEVLLFATPALLLWPEPERVTPTERLRRLAPFAIAAVLYLGLRMRVLGAMRSHEDASHLWRALSFVAPLELEGLAGALYPRRLHLRFLFAEVSSLTPATLALMALAVAGAAIAALGMRRRAPAAVFGLAWFATTLSPVALVASVLWPGFGRYLYLPAAGLAVTLAAAAAALYEHWPRLRPLLFAAGFTYLAMLAVVLRGWVEVFRDEETLYLTTIERDPGGAHGYGWLGAARMERGDPEAAIGPLVIAHEKAPAEVRYATLLLHAFRDTGRAAEAQALARDAAGRYERDADEFHIFMLNMSHDRDADLAAFHILECLRKSPGSRPCGDALRKLLLEHPLRARNLEAVRRQLQRPDLTAVRAQTAPLVDALLARRGG